jgi:lysophospholipase L1-like esterase
MGDYKYGLGAAGFNITGSSKNLIGYDTLIQEKVHDIDSSVYQDTVIKPLYEDVKQTTAFWAARISRSRYPRVKKYSKVTLIYSAEEPFTLQITADDSSVIKMTVSPNNIGIQSWQIPVRKQVRLDFLEGEFPKVFGLALDGTHGVAVDNFPMRGSSAQGFTTMNKEFYGGQLRNMNVKLIILQYGVNVIPGMLSDYGYYRVMLTRQLRAIKQAYPDISILVIGPSDMSMNDEGNFISYPNIPMIRNAMRDAAFANNCAFWDLYEAMGGENSMKSWVEAGYAQKDYTHFSFKGSTFVGEMIFEALLEQIQNRGYIN